MPEVSVIIPNYNHGPYLKLRIDSILTQTYDDIEIIILDDCSSDNSAEIIEAYRNHPKVSHIVFNEVNSGSTFKQWTKGINLAIGKWIWIAESDDWAEKTFLETFVPVFTNPKNVSIAFCQSHVINGEGKIIKTSTNETLQELMTGLEFIASRLIKRNVIINASMCVFRKENYYSVSYKHTQYKFIGDWLFWIEMAARGDVFISGKVLNYFRKHSGDVTSKAYKTGTYFLEFLRFVDDLYDLKFATSTERQKMIEKSFPKYFGSNLSDKMVRYTLSQSYHKSLGLKYYLILVDTYCKKIRNKISAYLATA